MEEQNKKNPWLGLESYKEGEILYGRDDDIRDLTQCVLSDIDTLLYGRSGIGKSSILNAGIIPAARRNGYLPVLVRFSHKEDHSYLYQIKDSIANAMIPIPLDESGNQIELSAEEKFKRENELAKRIKEVVKSKNKGDESLYEFFHCHTFHNAEEERIKLLIIFDQFEEIFTLQDDESIKKQFFAELADLLNDIMPTILQQNLAVPVENERPTIVENDDDFDAVFDNIDLGVKSEMPNFVSDNEIHWVFTIREDFLSEFEYYTASIPSLKQNRYGLRPINEEQAAQIIVRPVPGLIDESVAKLIIEKVTGKTDFKLDGIPEIEVDSAVLSLYLNRLYNAKTTENITSELIEEKGSEIIKDFYADAISGIENTTIEYLEDMLLNGQGRRDNITIYDAKHDGGATDEELDILCNKKKILRQFNYAGDLRIEYVHDILCPVVKSHKDERLLIKQQEEEKLKLEKEKEALLAQEKAKREKIEREAEEERLKQEREKKELEEKNKKYRNRVRLYLIFSFLLALLVAPLLYNFIFPPEQWQLQLVEDQTVGSENYWKVNVSILNEKSDTLYPVQTLDKSHCQTFYPAKRTNNVRIIVQFLAGNFNTIDTIMAMSDSITIPISRAYGRNKYEGKVVYGQSPGQPLKNAVVIIGNQITRTNHKGAFTAYVEQNDISNDGTIIIFKNGYTLLNTKIDKNAPYYKLQPEDSKAFEKRLSLVDRQLTGDSFEMTGEIAGSACHLKGCLRNDSIYGYYYYDSSVQQEKDLKYAKIVFSGKLNSDKTFHLDCCDWVYNIEELNGKINEDNSWEGYWHSYSPNLQKFKFNVIAK